MSTLVACEKPKKFSTTYYNTASDLEKKSINIRIGGRGLGKTCSAFYNAFTDFIENGDKFVIVRRQQTEPVSLLSDIACFFPENEISVEYDKKSCITTIFIDGDIAGFLLSLSCCTKYKSHYFNAKTIIFDEFIKAPTEKRVCEDEAFSFLELMETIIRDDTDVTVLLLSNATKLANDYFSMWQINIDILAENEILYINDVVNIKLLPATTLYLKRKSKTLTYQASINTPYFSYAYNNIFNTDILKFFVKEKKSFVLPANDDFYFSYKNNCYHVGEKFISQIEFEDIPKKAVVFSDNPIYQRNSLIMDKTGLIFKISERLTNKLYKRELYFDTLNTAVNLSAPLFALEV